MRRATIFVLTMTLVVLGLSMTAWAQDGPGTVSRVTYWTIQAGSQDQFEAGLARHNAIHVEQGDPSSLHTWQIVTGKRNGQYVRISGGHEWADFDLAGEAVEADEADSAMNIDPYIENAVPTIWNLLPEVSVLPEGTEPAALVRVIYMHLKIGSQPAFHGALMQIKGAIEKTGYDIDYLWYDLVDGGKTPTMAIVLPSDDWAGLAPRHESFGQMMAEGLGEEAEAVMGAIMSSIESEYVETMALRRDLSYFAAAD